MTYAARALIEALVFSTGVVALAEVGDKTQLLALVLAARYRRPLPIVLAILVATLANHALAGLLGNGLATAMSPGALRWILGISFIAMAAWLLIPDGPSRECAAEPRFGVFLTTLFAFFMLEMGDKTQIATVALAAKYTSVVAVIIGTTFGMMIANVPAVYLGEAASRRVPIRLVHVIAALVFLVLGVVVLIGA